MHSVADMRAGQAEEGQWEDRYFMYTTLDDNVGHVVHATLYTCEMKEGEGGGTDTSTARKQRRTLTQTRTWTRTLTQIQCQFRQ